MVELLLAVEGLYTGYGSTEILRGVDLAVQPNAGSSRCSAPTASANRP